MVNKLDTQWLDEALSSVDASDDYIADDGFTAGVMASIAQEESQRFLRMRSLILGIVGLVLAFGIFSLLSGHSIADSINYALNRYDWNTLLPVGAVFSLVISYCVTSMVKE